jgi:hypothetical protein
MPTWRTTADNKHHNDFDASVLVLLLPRQHPFLCLWMATTLDRISMRRKSFSLMRFLMSASWALIVKMSSDFV